MAHYCIYQIYLYALPKYSQSNFKEFTPKLFDGAAVGFVGNPNSFDLSNNFKPEPSIELKNHIIALVVSTGLSLVIK